MLEDSVVLSEVLDELVEEETARNRSTSWD